MSLELHTELFLFDFRPNFNMHLLYTCVSAQEDAFAFADLVGYPCLLRPSYVLR